MSQLIQEYNKHAEAFNQSFGGKTEWEVKPEEVAGHIAEMGIVLNKMFHILSHYDEETQK
jgi:hypothetical protein